jgi:hypothetical protein
MLLFNMAFSELMSDYVAQTEIDEVIHGLQTGRYRFLDHKAQQIKLQDGTTLNENFNDSKYSYISSLRNNPFSHSIYISNFLKWINEARKFGVLIENERTDLDQLDIESDKMVNLIIRKLHSLNILSRKMLGHELLANNAYLMQGLRYLCTTEPEFVFRIASIASIIDNLADKDGISTNLKNKPPEGSINLIQSFLREKNVNAERSIRIFRNLHHLRSKISPIHMGDYETIDILNDLDIPYPIVDWIDAGEKCLRYFLESLDLLISSLHQHKS